MSMFIGQGLSLEARRAAQARRRAANTATAAASEAAAAAAASTAAAAATERASSASPCSGNTLRISFCSCLHVINLLDTASKSSFAKSGLGKK
jgi:hypothetical protein